MLGIKSNTAPIRGKFAEKLREEVSIALAERERNQQTLTQSKPQKSTGEK